MRQNAGRVFGAVLWPAVLSVIAAGCGGGATSTQPVGLRTPFPVTTATPIPNPSVTPTPASTPTQTPPNVPAGRFRYYPLPTKAADPRGITAGPDGALWFTEAIGKIGRITTGGRISEFPLSKTESPGSITLGADGALWFTEEYSIGRMTTAGSTQDFPVEISGSKAYRLSGIAAGPDGALWFTAVGNYPASAIGRITTSGEVTSFALPPYRDPLAVTTGSDGALWFTIGAGFGSGSFESGIGRMTTTGQFTEFGSSYDLYPYQIASGSDGALWFTDAGYIGRITTTGQITLYRVLAPEEGPAAVSQPARTAISGRRTRTGRV
jgi:virginiamycin B lyase